MKARPKFLSAVIAVLMIITSIPFYTVAEDTVFDDVKASWYYDAVMYVYENQLMTGTGSGKFSPTANVTRGQMVQILFNMEGMNAEDYRGSTGFADSDNAWYSPAVKWAKESGVTSGVTDTTFAPNKSMTRQELTQFMRAYSQFKGFNTDNSKELDGFEDSKTVASWALPAIKWAVAEGIISGSDKEGKLYLNPTNTARRNELAVIIMNYHKGFFSGPVLRFAAMSDVHIGDTNTEESMRRTLRYINSFGEMDAFMFSGDLTNTTANTGKPTQIEKFDAIFDEEISYDTSMVYSLGPSHDLPYSSSGLACRALFNENLNEKYFNYDITPDDMAALGVRHSVIGGYHFFSVDHEGAGFYDEAWRWLVSEIEAAVAQEPNKPFFVSTHVPDMPHVTTLLSAYPQAICFTGHLHNSVAREDSIRQDNGFTNVHLGGMNYYRVDGYNRFNDNPFLNLGNIYDFAQAVYVEVYADNTVKLQRLDGYNSALIGESWEVSADTLGRYTDQRKSDPLCSFDDDAKLELLCLNDSYLKVSFDAATPGAAGPAQYYMIEWLMPVFGTYTTVEHVELSSQEIFFNGSTIPDLYYSYTFESDTFEDFAIRVTAFDCWGQSVNSLVYGLEGEEYGDINVTIRDFTPEEELTGMVTEGEQDISFSYGDSNTSRFSKGDSMAVRFCPTVDFSDVEIRCSSWGDTVGTLDFKLYLWQGDYGSTVASEPVDSYTLTGYKGSTVYNVFDDNYAQGEYLVVITTPNADEGVGVYHYPINGNGDAYLSYENGALMDTYIYLSWTNSKTCTKPYVPMK